MNETYAETKSRDDTNQVAKRRPWYVWDVVLLGVLFAYGTFGNSFPLLSYWGGLHNDKDLVFGAISWFGMLMPGAGICLLAALARIVVDWPRHIGKGGKLLVLQIATIVVTLAYVGLPFTSIGPLGDRMHMWGMRRYVQTQVDVGAIRHWLSSLDPNDCDGVQIDIRRNEKWEPKPEPNDPVLPPCVLSLEPRYVTLASVENQGLAVGLTWGSGMLGTWGLTIGPETMGAPPSDLLLRWPSYSQDVLPSVRIWYDVE